MNIKLSTFLSNLLFFLCLFPYLSPINLPSDNQPYALMVAVGILAISLLFRKDLKIPKILIPFAMIFAYSVILLLSDFSLVSIRSLFGYLTLFILPIAGYLTFKKVKPKLFVFSVRIWLIFGLLQQFVSRSIGTSLIARSSTSINRGVTSLAVEPSYYSIMCIFLLILNDVFYANDSYSKKTYKHVFRLLLLQMLLSRSGVGFVIFFIYLIAKIISQSNFAKLFQGSIIVTGLGLATGHLFTNVQSLMYTRIGRLINLAYPNPLNVFLHDVSSADRMAHNLIPFYSVFFNYGRGFGFEAWDDNAMNIASSVGGFVHDIARIGISYGDRIMSGWGAALFELGLIGLLLIFAFVFIMRKGIKRTTGKMRQTYISSLITIFFVMFMAVPLSFPLFSYVLGMFVYIQLKYKKSKEQALREISDNDNLVTTS